MSANDPKRTFWSALLTFVISLMRPSFFSAAPRDLMLGNNQGGETFKTAAHNDRPLTAWNFLPVRRKSLRSTCRRVCRSNCHRQMELASSAHKRISGPRTASGQKRNVIAVGAAYVDAYKRSIGRTQVRVSNLSADVGAAPAGACRRRGHIRHIRSYSDDWAYGSIRAHTGDC